MNESINLNWRVTPHPVTKIHCLFFLILILLTSNTAELLDFFLCLTNYHIEIIVAPKYSKKYNSLLWSVHHQILEILCNPANLKIAILIILNSDIEFNPGPVRINDGFSFWNINSLGKDDFSCYEISLNDQMEIPSPLMQCYNFESMYHPGSNKQGGVGIYEDITD